jgi:lipoprotein NlpI
LNKAITLDSKMPEAYWSRANVKTAKGDLNGALADYNEAIALDPKKPEPYGVRGNFERARGDLSGALSDYNKVIALDPDRPEAYIGLGNIKKDKGDLDGALADYNQAIALDPTYVIAYLARGNTNSLARNWTTALADYRQYCDLSRTGQDYPRLYIYLIRARMGERDAAGKELAAYMDKRGSAPGDWVAMLGGYLLGSVTGPDLFNAVASPDARKTKGLSCEAWYFAGMKKLLDGDKRTATNYFENCVATGQKNHIEFQLAQSELKALRK